MRFAFVCFIATLLVFSFWGQASAAGFSVNTYIISGPKEGEALDETNQVVFRFTAWVYPKETEGQIMFETKIIGFDDDWKETSSQDRVVELPAGPKEYTFFVRAKIGKIVDPTPAKRTFKINTSPYFGKVKISGASYQSSTYPSLITLHTNLKEGEKINITGWEIKGNGGSTIIPQGIEKYNPVYNSPASDDIILKSGTAVYLSGGSNPLGKNQNFQVNKCFGYLANLRNFPISISQSCPRPYREEFSYLSQCCQEYVSQMGSCRTPSYWDWVSRGLLQDYQCLNYVTYNFNYAGCFRNYSQDKNFLGNSWHIYIERNILSSKRDTLYLRDQNGLVVDKYPYGCCY